VTQRAWRSCRWCGRKFEASSGPGRPRLYCRGSCRQRDYEARRRAAELGLGEHELVITRDELERVRDRLHVLQCAVEDVERDLASGDDTESDESQRALHWLLEAAKHAVS
jgi:hypothetical protein